MASASKKALENAAILQDATVYVESMKGQRITKKPSREELKIKFAPVWEPPSAPNESMFFFGPAYTPSTASLLSLQQMTTDDLRLMTHHRGKVLVVRTFGNPHGIADMMNAVEDIHGGAEQLLVFNGESTSTPEQILPIDTVFAVKEPYYKITIEQDPVICVDHPSDRIELQENHVFYPREFLAGQEMKTKSVLECKVAGNAAYERREFKAARNLYTEGIELGGEDTQLMKDLQRNRAVVNMLLGRYEEAESDARVSIIQFPTPLSQREKELNSKAWFRIGRAAYELRRFKDAMESFERSVELNKANKASARESNRSFRRLEEATDRSYDLECMSKSVTKDHRLSDHADFVSNTVVQDAGSRGRGLFATRDISAGELVLCEKAFQMTYPSKTVKLFGWNLEDMSIKSGTGASLIHDTVQKLRRNPNNAGRFLDLYANGYQPKCPPTQIDNTVIMDTFEVSAILENVSFSGPGLRSSDEANTSGKDPACPCGVWITASYMNHSCVCNTAQSFIGDMMILRAVRNIAMGEEITTRYVSQQGYVSRDELGEDDFKHGALRSWDFECDCVICNADKQTLPAQRDLRVKLWKEASSFMTTNKTNDASLPSDSVIEFAVKLYRDLQKTYDPDIYTNGVPRLDLITLGSWIALAYKLKDDLPKFLAASKEIVECFGIIADDNEAEPWLTIDFKNPVLDKILELAVTSIAQSFALLKNHPMFHKYEHFARELYVMRHGDLDGFYEKYVHTLGLEIAKEHFEWTVDTRSGKVLRVPRGGKSQA